MYKFDFIEVVTHIKNTLIFYIQCTIYNLTVKLSLVYYIANTAPYCVAPYKP